MFSLSQELKEKFGDYALPLRALPKFMAWLVGPPAGGGITSKFGSRNVNDPFRAGNSKGIREFNLSYRPLQSSIEDMFQQKIDAGQFQNLEWDQGRL